MFRWQANVGSRKRECCIIEGDEEEEADFKILFESVKIRVMFLLMYFLVVPRVKRARRFFSESPCRDVLSRRRVLKGGVRVSKFQSVFEVSRLKIF